MTIAALGGAIVSVTVTRPAAPQSQAATANRLPNANALLDINA